MSTILLTTAAVLGLLSFFEPCTIATHTLFAVRASHDSVKQRWLALVQLTLSRVLLLVLAFSAAAAIGLAELSANTAMLMLSGIGLAYLITRKIYLPVPHLEFYRLLPRHDGLSQGFKLGLTLPACTLPLVAIVGVLSALTQRPGVAVLAGLVFAVMFTLPTLWDSTHELGAAQRVFLSKAANLSPYITTLLLWTGALLIWRTGG
jgi:cytochrome c-type biogenesis protein